MPYCSGFSLVYVIGLVYDNIILLYNTFMTTISVPLPAELLVALEKLVEDGIAANKADAIRKALTAYLEDQAVEAVLHASREPSLRGNLDTLAKKLRGP